jgi:hypothetical protein
MTAPHGKPKPNGRGRTKAKHPICGKVRYPSRQRAASAVMRLADNGKASVPLDLYACKACGGFHLTSH